MLSRIKYRKYGSSQSQIDIKNIKDGIVSLNEGSYLKIIKTSSINFQLKSEQEQDTIIDIYEGFLNSINFPIQILIRTRQLDITEYINFLNLRADGENEAVYKQQIVYFRKFIKELVKENKILSKYFYVIIPIENGSRDDFNLIKSQLNVRVDLIKKNLNKINISCHELNSVEIINLFYSFYNPRLAKIQPINREIKQDIIDYSLGVKNEI